MKTKMNKVLAVAMALIMVLALAACGGGSGSGKAAVVGTYTLYEMTTDGETIDNDLVKSLGMEEMFSLEMKADGTGILSMEGEDDSSITWDDKKIKDSSTGDEFDYTYQDGKLTMSDDDNVLVFQKK